MAKRGKVDVEWSRIEAAIKKAAATRLKVGVLASHNGNVDHGGVTMAELLAIHEFGAPAAGIPARKPIQTALREGDAKLTAIALQAAKDITSTKISVEKALDLMGAGAVALIKQTIARGDLPPPLKPATIAAKGSDRTLVDTGALLESIAHEVVPQ